LTRIIFILVLVFVSFTAVHANPAPGPYTEIGFSVLQTLALISHNEYPVFKDSTGTVIFYGGPTGVYIWSPSQLRSFGPGAESGVELRRYLQEPFNSGFLSFYAGGGRLWRFDARDIWILSLGVKFGVRDRLVRSFIDIDLEPYFALGVKLAGSEPEEDETDHYQFTL
jgi:hypothetical protein